MERQRIYGLLLQLALIKMLRPHHNKLLFCEHRDDYLVILNTRCLFIENITMTIKPRKASILKITISLKKYCVYQLLLVY